MTQIVDSERLVAQSSPGTVFIRNSSNFVRAEEIQVGDRFDLDRYCPTHAPSGLRALPTQKRIELGEALYAAMTTISDSERHIIYKYFGLGTYTHPQTLEEIAAKHEQNVDVVEFMLKMALERLATSSALAGCVGEYSI